MNHFHRHLSQYVSNILTVPFVTDTIVFSSNAGAAEYVGGALGEFVRTGELNGRPYYKQRDTEGKVDIFLYSDGGKWLVSDIGDGRHLQNHLLNNQDTDLPPRTNWLFAKEGQQWSNNDWSLKLEFTPLVQPCNLVRVSGGSRVWTDHWSKMGNYRFASMIFVDNFSQSWNT